MSYSAANFATALRQLLPRGPAWEMEPDDVRSKVLLALGTELARFDSRADELKEEADPRTALVLLSAWEALVGLPDDVVTEIPSTVTERRIAILAKLIARGGQSRQYFIDLAASLGFNVTITEYSKQVARVGQLRIGERLYGGQWAFVWQVNVDLSSPALSGWARDVVIMRVGDRVGSRLRSWNGTLLEAWIQKHKPAHTLVYFVYA